LLYFILFLCVTWCSEDLLKSWQKKDAFPHHFDIIWLLDSFGKFFHNPLGFTGPMDGLAIVAF